MTLLNCQLPIFSNKMFFFLGNALLHHHITFRAFADLPTYEVILGTAKTADYAMLHRHLRWENDEMNRPEVSIDGTRCIL